MKKIIILFLLSILLATSVLARCIDTDSGIKYYKRGIVTYSLPILGDFEEIDSCDGNTLTEWYCGTLSGGSVFYECPNFCFDGACKSEPPPPPSSYCGNGACDSGETCSTCSSDCGACPPPPPPPTSDCGDGTCDSGESQYSCPADCEAPPIPQEPKVFCWWCWLLVLLVIITITYYLIRRKKKNGKKKKR